MIEVMGGFSYYVNVETKIDGCSVKMVVYAKMVYCDDSVREELIRELQNIGFSKIYDDYAKLTDTMKKVISIVPSEEVAR